MGVIATQGAVTNPNKALYALASEAMTVPDSEWALGVVRSGTTAKADYGKIRLPDSDGELAYGAVYGQKDIALNDEPACWYGEMLMMPVTEAVEIGEQVMLAADTGKEGWVKLWTGVGTYKFGVVETPQATVGGAALIRLQIGEKLEV